MTTVAEHPEVLDRLHVAVVAERIRRKARRARLDLRYLDGRDDWDFLLDGPDRLEYSAWEARCRVEDMLDQARYRLRRETEAYVWAALDPEATEAECEVRRLLAPWVTLREALERGWAARR